MSEHYDAVALLALPKVAEGGNPAKGLLSWSRPYLVEEIRNCGVDVQVSRGYDAFNLSEGSVNRTYRPEYTYGQDDRDTTVGLMKLGAASLDHFDVIRNTMRPIYTETSTPFLNPNSIRVLARDKADMAHLVLQACGVYGREYVYVAPNDHYDNIEEVFSIPGEEVVAKPINGKKSEGVLVGRKTEVMSQLADAEVPYIVEEKMDFSNPIDVVQGINDHEQQRLNFANSHGVNKELRLYYFGENEWDGVLRVAKPFERDFIDDKWLFIDQDSIPGSLIENSASVVAAIQRVIKPEDAEFHIAIDWVYASSESQKDPSWRVMEVNAAEPQLVQVRQNREIGRRQHKKLATQISRIALR